METYFFFHLKKADALCLNKLSVQVKTLQTKQGVSYSYRYMPHNAL